MSPAAHSPALHVAIIMDGNGRWATRQGLARVVGHRAGLAAARRIVQHAPDAGITCLTLYAFSSDNWCRPPAEVKRIFWLLRAFLRLETNEMFRRGVRLQVIGRRDRLDPSVLQAIEAAESATAGGGRLLLRVAIDYSSRDSIARALAAAPFREASPDSLREHLVQALTRESGDVDLLIRTGGEKRLSDFLLWESAYAELLFSQRMWPEFCEADLDQAVAEFHGRERRFGAIPAA